MKVLTKDNFEDRCMFEPNTGCWLWMRGISYAGSPRVKIGHKDERARRVSFELYRGGIPDKCTICATCDESLCVNPYHMVAKETEKPIPASGTRLCRGCSLELPDTSFSVTQRTCDSCVFTRRAASKKSKRRNDRSYSIYLDSRDYDKRRGLSNDLTKEFIGSLLMMDCTWCGASPTEVKSTLDRLDNSIGHIRKNVVTACVRCNYVRRDMPLEAWKVVAPSMKIARELGLFGEWVAATHLSSRSQQSA